MALLEYRVKSQELIDLMQEIYPNVIEKYENISGAFIIKYANFVRNSKDITQEQLEQVLELLSKSPNPNMKIIELFIAEKENAKKSSKKSQKKFGNNEGVVSQEAGFGNEMAEKQVELLNDSIIKACIDKVRLIQSY